MAGYEVIKRNERADAEIRLLSGVYEVWVDRTRMTRTRVLASATADYEDQVEKRNADIRALIARERANGAYKDMAGENAAARAGKSKSAGGAGLGLSLVKHTMDALRGKVEVTSEIGKGSIFALYFPANER